MSIISLPSPKSASEWCHRSRKNNKRIGYVPTMGALHEGHLSLIAQAVAENDLCCVSIFVNPLQFDNPDDLQRYPVDFKNDLKLLENTGCAMVYTGTLEQFFPNTKNLEVLKKKNAGPTARGLEGDFRPGHLEGVATIVERLFETVGSCNAYFGEKDYQQTLVVKHIAENMQSTTIDMQIKVCPTVREDSGLALSSRNKLLTKAQKQLATKIYRSLTGAKDAWTSGVCEPITLEQTMLELLTHPEITVQYATVRDQDHWSADRPTAPISQCRALVAVYLDDIRLIDNLYLGESKAVNEI